MNLGSFQKRTKTVGLILFLLIVLGLAVFFGRNVTSLLSRASTCPAQRVNAVQVSANSAVVTWDTEEDTQGRVEYGTSATNLAFSAPEAAPNQKHNVPLTLLTPNTAYYYLVKIGNNKCDSSGQRCDTSCVPWTFTTASITPPPEDVRALPTVTPVAAPANGTTPSSGSAAPAGPSATPGLSPFCRQLQLNIGASAKDETSWVSFKQYDLDNNGILNGKDVITCIKEKK